MDTGRIICMGSYGTKSTKAGVKEPSVENEKKCSNEKRFLAQLECGIFEKQLAFTFAQFKVRFSWA